VLPDLTAESAVLVARAGTLRCALPVSAVIEIMRPLPVKGIGGVPRFVRGVALVRGETVPVLDLARLLSEEGGGDPARWVTVRAGEDRVVAVEVAAVTGVVRLGCSVAALPPLLGQAHSELIEAIEARDGGLLAILRSGCLVPDPVWQLIEADSKE
jgi:purine-binding chemotaxis protein CheW